jgi:hypothetical protein
MVDFSSKDPQVLYGYVLKIDSWPSLLDYYSKTNTLYWVNKGGGGCVDNMVNTLNVKTREVSNFKIENSDSVKCAVIFNKDFTKLYYQPTYKNIGEYDIATQQTKVLAEAPDTKDQSGNSSLIDDFALSDSTNILYFSERDEVSNKEIIKKIDLESYDVTTVLDRDGYYNLGFESVSPDGAYMWLRTNCYGCGQASGYDNEGEYYILDLTTGQPTLFFKGEKGTYDKTGTGVRVNEHLNLLGWVQSSK